MEDNENNLDIQIENRINEIKDLEELEKLEEKLVDVKAEKFRQKSWIDFLEKILFAWILGMLFFYMDFYIESGLEKLFALQGLGIINFLSVVTIGIVLWNRYQLVNNYREKLELERAIENKRNHEC